MANKIIVCSKTTDRWIEPRNDKFEVLTGKLRKKEGDQALIRVNGKVKLVMVEKSTNGYWWLVECKDQGIYG